MPVLLLAAIHSSSKAPFFIIGGALAVWAVVLAGIGLSRPEFPGDLRGQRGVIAVSLAIVVLAIGAAVLTS